MTRVVFMLVVLAFTACAQGVEQSPACARYTECIRALDESAGQQTDLDRFDPGGACWGSEEGATLCTRACTRGLEWETRRRPDPISECQP